MGRPFSPISPRAKASLQLPFNCRAIYHHPGNSYRLSMKGAGMKPPQWVSVWFRFYPTGQIPWLLKFFKEIDELISLKLVPGGRSLLFPAQSSLWYPRANSLLATLSAGKQKIRFRVQTRFIYLLFFNLLSELTMKSSIHQHGVLVRFWLYIHQCLLSLLVSAFSKLYKPPESHFPHQQNEDNHYGPG